MRPLEYHLQRRKKREKRSDWGVEKRTKHSEYSHKKALKLKTAHHNNLLTQRLSGAQRAREEGKILEKNDERTELHRRLLKKMVEKSKKLLGEGVAAVLLARLRLNFRVLSE